MTRMKCNLLIGIFLFYYKNLNYIKITKQYLNFKRIINKKITAKSGEFKFLTETLIKFDFFNNNLEITCYSARAIT
jgi:hypothetical protein